MTTVKVPHGRIASSRVATRLLEKEGTVIKQSSEIKKTVAGEHVAEEPSRRKVYRMVPSDLPGGGAAESTVRFVNLAEENALPDVGIVRPVNWMRVGERVTARERRQRKRGNGGQTPCREIAIGRGFTEVRANQGYESMLLAEEHDFKLGGVGSGLARSITRKHAGRKGGEVLPVLWLDDMNQEGMGIALVTPADKRVPGAEVSVAMNRDEAENISVGSVVRKLRDGHAICLIDW